MAWRPWPPIASNCQLVWRAVDSEVRLDWSTCEAIERIPGKVSGIWLFKGSRVPVKALFENLEDGASVDDFLTWFPGVPREQVQAVLDLKQAHVDNSAPLRRRERHKRDALCRSPSSQC